MNRKFIFLSFSIACIISIIACVIVDLALTKSITWSLYAILSVPTGWLLLSPLLVKKHGLILSLCSLTIFSLPFVFLLEKITPVTNWFAPIGIPSVAAGVPTVWLIYLLYRFLKINPWYKAAITVFIGGVLVNMTISYFVDMHLNETPWSLSTIISGAGCLIISLLLVLAGYYRVAAKKKKPRTTY